MNMPVINDKITVNGREYPCKIRMGALLRFKRATGRDVSEMRSSDTTDLITFLWCCVASACNADKVPFDLSLDDFADGLDYDSLTGFYESNAEEDADGQKKSQE